MIVPKNIDLETIFLQMKIWCDQARRTASMNQDFLSCHNIFTNHHLFENHCDQHFPDYQKLRQFWHYSYLANNFLHQTF